MAWAIHGAGLSLRARGQLVRVVRLMTTPITRQRSRPRSARRRSSGEGAVTVVFQPHLYLRGPVSLPSALRRPCQRDHVLAASNGAREDPEPGVDLDADRVAASRGRPTSRICIGAARWSVSLLTFEGGVCLTMGVGSITHCASDVLDEGSGWRHEAALLGVQMRPRDERPSDTGVRPAHLSTRLSLRARGSWGRQRSTTRRLAPPRARRLTGPLPVADAASVLGGEGVTWAIAASVIVRVARCASYCVITCDARQLAAVAGLVFFPPIFAFSSSAVIVCEDGTATADSVCACRRV